MRETTAHDSYRADTRSPWSDGIFYRVDVRTFSDSDGDGVGDLNGVRERLGYLELLGVDGIWVTGVLASPVGKPGQGRDVDPLVGTIESFAMLLDEVHAAGLVAVLDIAVSARGMNQSGAHEELAGTLRFWMDRGVDGFRAAAIPGITEPAGRATHEVLRLARPVVDEYRSRFLGALVQNWNTDLGQLREIDVGIDLRFGAVPFDAEAVRDLVDTVLADARAAGAQPVWPLSRWENRSPATRLGQGHVGLARARAMALVQFALPGLPGVDNGTELGLPATGGSDRASHYPARLPMPWEGTRPPYGFSEASGVWWPEPHRWADSTVEAQLEDPNSTLSLYREALDIRRVRSAFRGDGVRWYGAPDGCLAFRRDGGGLTCALNTSDSAVPLPPGEVLLSSGPLDDEHLPAGTAVWTI